MKTNLYFLTTFLACMCFYNPGKAQCGTRYVDSIFTYNVTTVTYDVYDSLMDIYQPVGDTSSKRPLIVLAHEGTFIGGNKTDDPTVLSLCQNFAARGYVVASINYRLLPNVFDLLDSTQALTEVIQAMGDCKAAVRYFSKDAAMGNIYKIDTNRMFIGGNSAGAVLALHYGYITSVAELPSYLQTIVNANGGIEGNSGNAGYTSKVAAVISCAGGLNNPAWVTAGGVPSFNAQGTADDVVPYYCADAENGEVPLRLCGLGSLQSYYTAAGINESSLLFPSQGHVPWDANATMFYSLDSAITAFLASGFVTPTQYCLSGGLSVSLGSNQMVCAGTSVALTTTVSGGQPPYTYAWSSTGSAVVCNNCSSTTATINVNSTYTVTVTDQSNTTATASVTYGVSALGTVQIITGGAFAICTGHSIALSLAQTYSAYQWSTGSTAASISVSQPGTYGLTVSNGGSCSMVGSASVSGDSLYAEAIIGNPSITPFQNYSYSVTSVNGVTYSWNATGGAVQSGQTSNSASIEWGSTGPYEVILIQTNGAGCSDTSYLAVAGSTCSLTTSIITVGASLPCTGDTVLLIAQAAGTDSYQWLENGSALNGATGDTLAATNGGTYQVQVTSGSCTVLSAGSTLTYLPGPVMPVVTTNGNANACISPSLTLLTGTGYNNYLWNTGAIEDSITVTASGIYTVTVTGANGCKSVSLPYNVNLSFVTPFQICLVTVDSVSGKNTVIWDKPGTFGVDSFLIYKQTNQLNIFAEIGSVYKDSFSTFTDLSSSPQQQSDIYKLAVLDTCGNVTLQSTPHQTIHLSINQGLGGVWNLIWNAYEGFTFASYNVYRNTASGGLQLIGTVASNITSYTDLTPPTDVNNYVVAVVNPGGCSPSRSADYGTSYSNIVSVQSAGTDDIALNTVKVYPTVTTGNLIIDLGNGVAGVHYTITDLNGKQLTTGAVPVSSGTYTINLKSFAAGAYIVSLLNAGYCASFKVIKMD